MTPQEAYKIALQYLKESKRDYLEIDEVTEQSFSESQKIIYGTHLGEYRDVWSVCYGVEWGFDTVSYFIEIDSETGDVLYTISPQGIVEEFEEGHS